MLRPCKLMFIILLAVCSSVCADSNFDVFRESRSQRAKPNTVIENGVFMGTIISSEARISMNVFRIQIIPTLYHFCVGPSIIFVNSLISDVIINFVPCLCEPCNCFVDWARSDILRLLCAI